jgi:hypothetical protein
MPARGRLSTRVLGFIFDEAKQIWKTSDDGHDESYRPDLPSGPAEWSAPAQSDPDYWALIYVCPCGCGKTGAVPVTTGQKRDKAWLWDGDFEKPTLTPTILRVNGCRWHGYLTAGFWKRV